MKVRGCCVGACVWLRVSVPDRKDQHFGSPDRFFLSRSPTPTPTPTPASQALCLPSRTVSHQHCLQHSSLSLKSLYEQGSAGHSRLAV